MIAFKGVARNAPIIPNAAVIASTINIIDTGWIFIVLERIMGKITSAITSSNAIIKTATHSAVVVLIESATSIGGMLII